MEKFEGLICNIVEDHFEDFDFYRAIKLNNKFPLELHWSNDPHLTKRLRSSIKEGHFKEVVNKVSDDLDKLKDVPLWLKLEDSVLKLSAFDLYHTLCRHFRSGEFEDQLFNSQEISFISPAGPFKHLSLVECIHAKTLEAFVFKNILQNNLAQRSFRLHAKGSATLSFGEFHEENAKVYIDQVTDNGILFKCDDFKLLEVLDDDQFFKIHMTTKHLEKFFDTNYDFNEEKEDLFFSSNITEFFKVKSSSLIKTLKYDSTETGEYYLFCRYIDMFDGEHAKVFTKFIEGCKEVIKVAA